LGNPQETNLKNSMGPKTKGGKKKRVQTTKKELGGTLGGVCPALDTGGSTLLKKCTPTNPRADGGDVLRPNSTTQEKAGEKGGRWWGKREKRLGVTFQKRKRKRDTLGRVLNRKKSDRGKMCEGGFGGKKLKRIEQAKNTESGLCVLQGRCWRGWVRVKTAKRKMEGKRQGEKKKKKGDGEKKNGVVVMSQRPQKST